MSHTANIRSTDVNPANDESGRGAVADFLIQRSGLIRLLSIIMILAALLLIVRTLPVEVGMRWAESWLAGLGVWGPVAFIGIYIGAALLFVPGLALTLMAGVLFGLVGGLIIVSIASTTAAALAFLIGRYFARDAVQKQARNYPTFGAIDRAIGAGGWKIIFMLRLVPVFPFSIGNYLLGLTPVRFWHYVAASWIGMLPGTFVYIYLGHVGRKVTEAAATDAPSQTDPLEWVLLIVGGVMAISVIVYMTRLVRAKLKEQADLESLEPTGADDMPAEPTTPPVKSPVQPALFAMTALAILILGACSTMAPNWLTGLFGPPAVTLAETYDPKPDGPTYDHSALDAILKQHVNANGGVDYKALIANPKPLLDYNRALADAPWDDLGRDEKLALLINAYNSFTLELMIEHLPKDGVDKIQDIPDAQRWKAKRWNIAGNLWSLNDIEHKQIRPHFKEPRIHWAVVCAAVGCPPLRAEAYQGSRIDAQLADQEKRVHTDGSRWFRYDQKTNTLHLTQLYNWYGGDFIQISGSVLSYIAKRVPEVSKAIDEQRTPKIEFLHYDWSLNDQENLPK